MNCLDINQDHDIEDKPKIELASFSDIFMTSYTANWQLQNSVYSSEFEYQQYQTQNKQIKKMQDS